MTAPTTTGGALAQPDAAHYLGMSVRTLRRLVERGDIAPRYVSERPVYLRRDLDALLEAAPTEPRASA